MFILINKFKIKQGLFILAIFSLFFANKIYAASLSLSPEAPTVSVGNIISVKVLVNTDGKAINNSESVIQFPSDLLEVVSISKNSSIFSLWVEEPSFTNTDGKIVFNGGIPNPGFTGQGGYIASVTFKAKKQGVASVLFADSAVRENDGLGTDILTSKNGSVIKIGIPEKIEVTTPIIPVVKNNLPVKPVVSSTTNPDQDSWYSTNTVSFDWKIPGDVTSIKTLIDKVSDSSPTTVYDSSVSQKTINNLSDGTYYFHIRYVNSAGSGPITHYKIKIDSTAPKSFIPVIRNDGYRNLIKLNAEDKISGIDYYTLSIDNSSLITVNLNELIDSEYSLPFQSEGSHSIVVTAYDKAKNHAESILSFVSPKIIIPQLFLSSNEITKGDTITISGKTGYPNKKVDISLEFNDKISLRSIMGFNVPKEIKKYTQTIGPDGTFSITTDAIKEKGTINIWAEVVFPDNIKSQSSEIQYLKVKDTKIVSATLSLVYPILIIIIMILIIIIFMFIFYFGWNKFLGQKVKINNELQSTVKDVHSSMMLLKEELNNQLSLLEKTRNDRDLNNKEEVIFNEIKLKIDNIDNFIQEKLNKIM